FNASETDPVKFLQIWLFPNQQNVEPRYDQIRLDPENRKNRFQQLVSPDPNDEGAWIHQDAWFHMVDLDQDKEVEYVWKAKGNGVFLFVLEGAIEVEGSVLSRRDAIGVTEADRMTIRATKGSSLLLIEVPML